MRFGTASWSAVIGGNPTPPSARMTNLIKSKFYARDASKSDDRKLILRMK